MLLDEFGLSLGELAERVGKAKPTVSNRLRLLELPDDVLGLVERGELTEGHARAVLAVPDHDGRRRLARQIVGAGMSVRAAERAARWAGAKTKPRKAPTVDPALAGRARERGRAADGLPGADRRGPARDRLRGRDRARRARRSARGLPYRRPAAEPLTP